MGSWHDQWRDAWREVAQLDDGFYKNMLRNALDRARELIRSENPPDERRRGGLIVADVRAAVIDRIENGKVSVVNPASSDNVYVCVVDESAGLSSGFSGESSRVGARYSGERSS